MENTARNATEEWFKLLVIHEGVHELLSASSPEAEKFLCDLFFKNKKFLDATLANSSESAREFAAGVKESATIRRNVYLLLISLGMHSYEGYVLIYKTVNLVQRERLNGMFQYIAEDIFGAIQEESRWSEAKLEALLPPLAFMVVLFAGGNGFFIESRLRQKIYESKLLTSLVETAETKFVEEKVIRRVELPTLKDSSWNQVASEMKEAIEMLTTAEKHWWCTACSISARFRFFDQLMAPDLVSVGEFLYSFHEFSTQKPSLINVKEMESSVQNASEVWFRLLVRHEGFWKLLCAASFEARKFLYDLLFKKKKFLDAVVAYSRKSASWFANGVDDKVLRTTRWNVYLLLISLGMHSYGGYVLMFRTVRLLQRERSNGMFQYFTEDISDVVKEDSLSLGAKLEVLLPSLAFMAVLFAGGNGFYIESQLQQQIQGSNFLTSLAKTVEKNFVKEKHNGQLKLPILEKSFPREITVEIKQAIEMLKMAEKSKWLIRDDDKWEVSANQLRLAQLRLIKLQLRESRSRRNETQ